MHHPAKCRGDRSTVAKIWRFFSFQDGGLPPAWTCGYCTCLDHPQKVFCGLHRCVKLAEIDSVVNFEKTLGALGRDEEWWGGRGSGVVLK